MLSFLFYWLLKTPRAYQAIRSEVDTVCGNEPVKVEHLQKLKYIDASLKEALRLNSTAPAWTVTPIKDEVLADGKYAVREGQPIMIILDSLHRDPAVWGEDAEEFRLAISSLQKSGGESLLKSGVLAYFQSRANAGWEIRSFAS
jgi:cytochrome P450/NADPH-cytochrome P450 reductase